MGTKATYIDGRSGNHCTTPTFGSRAIAETYVRNLKGAKDVTFIDTDVAACATVTAVDEGTADKQRAASKAFYAPIKAARQGIIVKDEPYTREQEAELDMETFSAAMAAGVGSAAALEEVNYRRLHG